MTTAKRLTIADKECWYTIADMLIDGIRTMEIEHVSMLISDGDARQNLVLDMFLDYCFDNGINPSSGAE